MKNPHEFIVPGLVVLLLTSVSVWMLHRNAGEFLTYNELYNHGKRTEAVVVMKGVERGDSLEKRTVTHASDVHKVMVAYPFLDDGKLRCIFTVSKLTYDILGRRDELVVTYLPRDPSICTLPDNLELSRNLLMTVNIVAVVLLLLAAGFVYYMYTSFRQPPPGKPVPLTNDLGIPESKAACPRCGAQMAEGYLPSVGGISWRDRTDPVGMPTMLSGLPGTTVWFKRPMLHAYRCTECRIVVFKYGE